MRRSRNFLSNQKQALSKLINRLKKRSDRPEELSQTSKYRWVAVVLAATAVVAVWVLTLSPDPRSQKPATTTPNDFQMVSDICAQNNIVSFGCYKAELSKLTQQKGPQAAFDLLKQQYDKVDYVKSQCHQLVHVVGRAALSKYGNIADTYSNGDQYCWSGYYHGALEQLADDRGVNFLVEKANEICASVPGKETRSFYYYNCVHGLGHGYMFVQHGELFKSLTACDSLVDSFDRTSCYGGVFMQNIMNEQSPDAAVDHPKAYLKADQPMYPCTAVADKYKDQCYLMQTSYALRIVNYDFSRGFDLCGGIEPAYRNTCYVSLGRDASGSTVSDVTRTKNSCLLGPSFEAQKFCIEGAAKDFVSYFHSDVQAKQLCSSLDISLKDHCLSIVQTYYSSFSRP